MKKLELSNEIRRRKVQQFFNKHYEIFVEGFTDPYGGFLSEPNFEYEEFIECHICFAEFKPTENCIPLCVECWMISEVSFLS